MNLFRQILTSPSDFLNPLLVREVRQSLRSNLFVTVISLASLVSVVAVIAGLMNMTDSQFDYSNLNYYSSSDSNAGGYTVFAVLFLLVWLIACVGMPILAAQRFRGERSGGEFELFMITGVSAWRVVSGKLQANLIQTLLTLSVVAPFLLISYLLRGISILTISISILCLIFCSLFLTQTGILVGGMKAKKGLYGAISSLFGLGLIILCFAMVPFMLDSGSRRIFSSGFSGMGTDGILLILFFVGLILALLLSYFASVAILELPNKNREIFLKIHVMFMTLVGIGIARLAPAGTIPDESLQVLLALPFSVMFIIASLYLSSGCPLAPMNVRKHWSRWKCIVFAPFYPGKGSYMIWLSLIAFSLLLVGPSALKMKGLVFLFVCFSAVAFWIFFIGNFLRLFLKKMVPVLRSLIALGIVSIVALLLSVSSDASIRDLGVLVFPLSLASECTRDMHCRVAFIPASLCFWGFLFLIGVITYRIQLRKEKILAASLAQPEEAIVETAECPAPETHSDEALNAGKQ